MNLEMENNRQRFYQWDTGQRLIVHDAGCCNQVHFAAANLPQALVCEIKEKDGVRVVDVPNILLQYGDPFYAYLYYFNTDGTRTECAHHFEVSKRPRPASYVYTETEVLNYSSLAANLAQMEKATVRYDSSQKMTDEQKAQARDNIGAVGEDVQDQIINMESFVGLPAVIASGTAEAVAPAYTSLVIADGISLKSGKTYVVTGAVATELADYSVWIYLNKVDSSTLQFTSIKSADGTHTCSFSITADADYSNLRLTAKTNVTSGLSVTASVEIVEEESLLKIAQRHAASIAAVNDRLTEVDDILQTAFALIEPVAFDGVERGKVYNKSFPNGASLSQYDTYYKAVTSDEVFLITSAVVPDSKYSAASFWDHAGNYISGAGFYDDVGADVTDFKIAVPSGAALMRVVTKASVTPTAKRVQMVPVSVHDDRSTCKTSVTFEDEVCQVQTLYNENEMLVIEIRRGGGNNLPDIKRVYVTDRNGAELRTIVFSGTDIFSPHIVKAENNADGDNLNDSGVHREYFTGGNHQYNNNGSGSTATARCPSFSVIDLGQEVVVKWTNVKDLAEVLSISQNTAYTLVRSGEIRSIRTGRTYRIPKDAVIEYLNKS